MLVDWEVETNARQKLVRTVEQYRPAHGLTLRVAVQNVADVGRHVDVLAQPAIHKSDDAEVTNVAARAGATLQLIEALEVVRLVWIPTIKGMKPQPSASFGEARRILAPTTISVKLDSP